MQDSEITEPPIMAQPITVNVVDGEIVISDGVAMFSLTPAAARESGRLLIEAAATLVP